jgi:hypothetical protein
MRPGARLSTFLAIAGVGAGMLGTSSSALASDFALTLSGPTTTTVGQPTVFRIDGANPPPSAYPFPSWLDVSVIPITATPTCPQSDSEATELAPAAGGGNMALSLPEHADVTGHFSAVAGFTPIGPGVGLICAYTQDGADNTLAIASLTLTIRPKASPPTPTPTPTNPAPPRAKRAPTNLAPPHVTRSRTAVSCSRGRWSGTVRRYTYRWLVSGRLKANASASRLQLTRALRGRVLRCSVTATGPSGQSTTATSSGVRG